MATLEQRPSDGYVVERSDTRYAGRILGVREDHVRFPDGSTARRDVVTHGGAVGVVALDEDGGVVLIEQYRPAVRRFLWELPAGILDVDGEHAVEAAQRELAEEVGLRAERWDTLVDLVSAAGFCEERVRVYLARDLHDAPVPDGFVRENEEADLIVRRVPLADCVRAVHDGTIINSLAVAGLLAASRAVEDPSLLRPATAPWPA
ncbi:NUDIX domain-containing protein [Cumulibacter manganitolerans]|uniref:NUDIX domain-containing protein n=1 Tax=Cumulibacter manganitolerans TaxID=1884992 RepID=UPI001297650C|nr:NUDIX hydrolase [Cumulibacter manganitolerans]